MSAYLGTAGSKLGYISSGNPMDKVEVMAIIIWMTELSLVSVGYSNIISIFREHFDSCCLV